MLLVASIISIFIACLALVIGVCFTTRNKFANFILSLASLFALLCLGIICASIDEEFYGYEIFMIISILPMFLYVSFNKNKHNFPLENNNTTQDESGSEIKKDNTDDKDKNTLENLANGTSTNYLTANMFSVTPQKNINIAEKYNDLVIGISYFLTSFCIFFCGLYLGLESFYGVLIAIFIGFALSFLYMIIKKDYKNFEGKRLALLYLEKFLLFVSVGFLISSVIISLIYSFNLTNVLFSLGALSCATYIMLEVYYKSKFNHLAYFIGMLLMIATFLI